MRTEQEYFDTFNDGGSMKFEGEIGEPLSKVNEFRQKMEEMQKKVAKMGADELHKAFLPLFDKNPKLESLTWTQYTPYFNDGDECVFSVNVDYLSAVYGGVKYDGVNVVKKEYSYTPYKATEPKVVLPGVKLALEEGGKGLDLLKGTEEGDNMMEAIAALQGLLDGLGDDLCRTIWGNHVEVTLSREGFTTEDYDHE